MANKNLDSCDNSQPQSEIQNNIKSALDIGDTNMTDSDQIVQKDNKSSEIMSDDVLNAEDNVNEQSDSKPDSNLDLDLDLDVNDPKRFRVPIQQAHYNMKTDFEILKNLLESKTPFHFSHQNDGEISLMTHPKTTIASRGNQPGDQTISEAIRKSLYFRAENFYVGIPCSNCYPSMHENALKVTGTNQPHVMLANTLINSNYQNTLQLLKKIMPERNVVLVTSVNSDVDAFSDYFNVKPVIVIEVPNVNAWSVYNDLKDKWKDCVSNGDLVLFCCGPLGRVLSADWFRKNETITSLELGSLFDPITQKQMYLYHQKILHPCSVCNPEVELTTEEQNFEDSFKLNVLDKCTWHENFNFMDWDACFGFYNGNLKTICRFYNLNLAKSDNFNIQFYCLWMLARCCRLMNYPLTLIESAYLQTKKQFDFRVEAVWEFVIECRNQLDRKHRFELLLSIKDKWLPNTDNCYWVDRSLYEWRILDEVSSEGYHVNQIDIGYAASKLLVANKKYPDSQKSRIENNLKHYERHYADKDSYNEFKKEIAMFQETQFPMLVLDEIPNIIHFVFIGSKSYKFGMLEYIAVKSAYEIHNPDAIFIFANEEPAAEDTIWWNKAKKYAKVVIVTIPRWINGHEIWAPQHQADVMRINILNSIGGVYFDLDIMSIKSIAPLIKKKKIVMCNELEKGLANCVILAPPNTKFMSEWIKQYETKYGELEDWWVGLSIRMPLELSKQFSEEIEIIEGKCFIPFMYCNYSIFDSTKDTENDFKDSYCVHLWTTELYKNPELVPRDAEYFSKNNNTFSRMFAKYAE